MSNLKEEIFETNTLIGGWYIPETLCDDMVNYFNKNKDRAVPGLLAYKENNRNAKKSLDLGISSKNFEIPFYDYRNTLQSCLDNYLKKYPYVDRLEKFNVVEDYNIQYYKPKEGFYVYHYEDSGQIFPSRRCLVFLTYLNDVKDGGTQFYYQGITVKAKKGLTLIWPAYFTHTHKGQISMIEEKYILTGWFSYEDIKSEQTDTTL